MKFFIPFTTDEQQEQQTYAAIKKFLENVMQASFSERKIFSLRYQHDGKDYYAEVGRIHAVNGETVIAILYEPMRALYHICSPTRGVVRGHSIIVSEQSVSAVVDFDD